MGVLFSFLITIILTVRNTCAVWERELAHVPAFLLVFPSNKQKETPTQLICSEVHDTIYPVTSVSVSLYLKIWAAEPWERTPALRGTAMVLLPTLPETNTPTFAPGKFHVTTSVNIPGRRCITTEPSVLLCASARPLRAVKTAAVSHLQASGSSWASPRRWESTSGRRDFHGKKLCSC